jgi:hypothetical protein
MSRASKLTRQIQKILREKGESPGETGPDLVNLVAARKRKEASGKSDVGRPLAEPRLVIKHDTIKIKHSGERIKTTGIKLRPGMDAMEVELAAETALDDFNEEQDAKDRQEVSPEDISLKEINLAWIKSQSSSASRSLDRTRRRWADQLERDFPAKRLGDIVHGSGDAYIEKVVEGVTDEDKRRTLHNSAVEKLRMQRKAIESFYDNLTNPPDHRKRYSIKGKIKRRSVMYLTWDQLMRLLKAAEGWKYNVKTGEWTPDPDPDLLVVRRYILIYFYSGTRDETILPLQWGQNAEGGYINAATGIIYRKPPGAERTNKRAEPAHLLGTLREEVKQWEREDLSNGWIHVLHDVAGGEITDMTPRFDKVKRKAGLPWLRAHELKHTGVTLLTHASLNIDTLATAMSTLAATLRDQYQHLAFLWQQPRTTTSVDVDLTLEALQKTSPMSDQHWLDKAGATIELRRARAEAREARAKQSKRDYQKRKAQERKTIDPDDASSQSTAEL